MVFEITILTVLVMAAVGALSAYLANQNIAVFNDGLRPMYPQYLSGAIDRKTLFATSFALSFGLVVGFGLPTSIAGKIILIHTVLLGCDIIGTAFKDDKKGGISAAVVGAVFSIILLFGMQGIVDFISILPINFLDDLSNVGALIIISFCVFPALAIAYQSNVKNGFIALAVIMLAKQLTVVYGTFTIGDDLEVVIDSNGIALLVGIVAMIFVAARDKRKGDSSAASLFSVFEKNIERIRKNILLLSITGGFIALATSLMLIAEGPASLALTAEGQYDAAAIVAFGRCLGFIPLVMTTAIISGVYAPSGTKAIHIPAILLINTGIIGLVGSFVIGCLIMAVEIVLLGFIARGMDKFPGMKELGDNARTAMSKVLDLALLVGGMLAANAISPSLGYIWVMGLYFLNGISKKPISPMAIGPLGAISLGIIVNILHFVGLFPTPPAP